MSTEPDYDDPRLAPDGAESAVVSYNSIIEDNRSRLVAAGRHAVEGHAEFTKTITTLSSGALVLSISVVQLMASRLPATRISWLLPIAWSCFGITIILVGFRVIWLQKAQSFDVNYASARIDLENKVRSLPTKSELERFIEEVIAPQFDAATRTGAFHKRLDLTQTASVWLFTGGMISLLVFAIANLPR